MSSIISNFTRYVVELFSEPLAQFDVNHYSAYFAFLLPAFSTFKALAHRPVSEPDLERLCMYWTVMGVFVAFQYTAEWLISW